MTTQFKFGQYPDINGYFGRHGGRFVSETLMAALEEFDKIYQTAKADPTF